MKFVVYVIICVYTLLIWLMTVKTFRGQKTNNNVHRYNEIKTDNSFMN